MSTLTRLFLHWLIISNPNAARNIIAASAADLALRTRHTNHARLAA